MTPQNMLRPAGFLAVAILMTCPTPAAQSLGFVGQGCGGPATMELPPLAGPDVNSWTLEAPITAYDLASRTLTAGGLTLFVPASVLIDVNGDGIGDIALGGLLDARLEAQHSVLGGTLKAEGHLQVLTIGCARVVADLVGFEFAEHVLICPLSEVVPQSAGFVVGSTFIRMNDDPRVPSDLLDVMWNQIDDLRILQGSLGTLVSVEGYLEAGVLVGVRVETEAFVADPLIDVIGIEKASWDEDDLSLRVKGRVSPDPSGDLATQLDLYLGPVGPSGSSCAGLYVTNIPVLPDLGLPGFGKFSFETPSGAVPTFPGTICIHSPNGEVEQAPVSIK